MDIRATPALSLRFSEGQYRKALAHSTRVRRLKILLPMLALVISLAFIAVSWIRTMFPAELSIAGATIENGSMVMERPAISGRNNEGISYFMNARRALQNLSDPNDIVLEDIEAAVPVRTDLIAKVIAKKARFNRATDRLDMLAPFSVTLSSGLRAEFQSAHLDVRAGLMQSDAPVSISAKGTSIVANSVKITDKGRVIILDGKVRMVVVLAEIRSQAEQGQLKP